MKLDLSTQGLKATLISRTSDAPYETGVQFETDLPEFETKGGVHRHPGGLKVTSPALMWVTALDLLLERIARADL